jgi:hypothetical protein
MDLGKVLKLIGKNEAAQYGILKVRKIKLVLRYYKVL